MDRSVSTVTDANLRRDSANPGRTVSTVTVADLHRVAEGPENRSVEDEPAWLTEAAAEMSRRLTRTELMCDLIRLRRRLRHPDPVGCDPDWRSWMEMQCQAMERELAPHARAAPTVSDAGSRTT
jgi:hypothetical protein